MSLSPSRYLSTSQVKNNSLLLGLEAEALVWATQESHQSAATLHLVFTVCESYLAF